MTRPAPMAADLLVGLGGAAVLAAGLAATRGELAGGLVGGLAVFGLLVRWGSAPPVVLLAAAYLCLFPDGVPFRGPQDDTPGRPVPSLPTLLDLLSAGAAVVYAAGHYRQLARLADAADEPTADDLARLFAGAGTAVLAGAAVLVVSTQYEPDTSEGRLRLVPVAIDFDPLTDRFRDPLELVLSRSVVLAGLLGGGALLAGTALWLTRVHRLSPGEARQLLLDTRWREARRELVRLETWRAVARQPRPARLRLGRTMLVGGTLFAATFLLVWWVLSRLK